MNWRSLKFWDRSIKSSRVSGVGVTNTGDAQWSDRNYDNFARESYMKNVVAFACIDRIAKATSLVPWKIISTRTQEQDLNHPINKLLTRANPEESWVMFLYGTMSYLCMAGNAFIEKVGPKTGKNNGAISELWNLRPDRVAPEINDKGLKTRFVYRYNSSEVYFPIDQVTGKCDLVHIRTFNPTNEFFGMSVIEPTARKIDSSNSMDEWNKRLLDNSARPGMLLMFKDGLSDKQYERLGKEMKTKREGAENSGRSMILEGATDAKPYGFSPSEMDWINSNKELARSICIAFGVPPQLIGIPDVSTYSNYQEARAAFYEDTILFWLTLLQSEFNAGIVADPNYSMEFVIDDIPAMQFKRTVLWDRARESDFLTINEKRQLVGGYDDITGGDVVLQPATMIPIDAELDDVSKGEEQVSDMLKRLGYNDEDIKRFMKC